MENKKISVIIPTYNRAKIITKSVESVLNQTYKNIEVIIVDDCSKDNTDEVIKNIGDKRIKYYKLEKNGGSANARNYGIKKATGDYIAFQDSDDVYSDKKLEYQMKNILKNNADVDFCKICIHDKDQDAIVPNEEDDKLISKTSLLDRLCINNIISTQALLVKSSILKKNIFDTSIPNTEDYDLALRLTIDYKVSYTKKVLVDLYRQDDSISYSMEKLRKSSLSMLRKDYKLTDEQEKNLQSHLFDQATRQKLEEYDALCRNLKKEIDEKETDNELLNKKVKKLNEEKEELDSLLKKKNEDYDNIEKKYNELNTKYKNIFNSKRWKVANKIFKIKK